MDLHEELLNVDNPILFPKMIINITNIRNNYQHYLRKALLVILLVSLLSFLLSLFTGLSFLNCYTYYSSTFLLPFISQTFERKYMFLLCNGILVFLARKSDSYLSSGLQTEEEATETYDNIQGKMLTNEYDVILQPAEPDVDPPCEESADSSVKGEVPETQAEQKEAAAEKHVMGEVNQVEEEADLASLDEKIHVENEETCGMIIGGDYDDGESEGPASNTEEFNKKIEEFIRRMKEELQLEAQHQQIIAA